MRQISTLEPTRYEITATTEGRAFLICYAAGSPSASRLARIVIERGPAIARSLAINVEAVATFQRKPRIAAAIGGWLIGYSGRTQREAQRAELPLYTSAVVARQAVASC